MQQCSSFATATLVKVAPSSQKCIDYPAHLSCLTALVRLMHNLLELVCREGSVANAELFALNGSRRSKK